jgi:hypothetical protein
VPAHRVTPKHGSYVRRSNPGSASGESWFLDLAMCLPGSGSLSYGSAGWVGMKPKMALSMTLVTLVFIPSEGVAMNWWISPEHRTAISWNKG